MNSEKEEQESADVLESLKNDKKFMMGRIANLEIFNETLDQQNKTLEERLQFYEQKISQLEEDNARLEKNNDYLQVSLNKMELNIVSLESKEESLQESLYYHKIQEQNLKDELNKQNQRGSNESIVADEVKDLESLTFYCKSLLKVVLEKAPELLNKEFLYG